jgi:hypothetical protein
MAETLSKAVAEAKRPEHRVKIAKAAAHASRSSLRRVLADHPGAEATAVAEAFNQLDEALASLSESLNEKEQPESRNGHD